MCLMLPEQCMTRINKDKQICCLEINNLLLCYSLVNSLSIKTLYDPLPINDLKMPQNTRYYRLCVLLPYSHVKRTNTPK